MKDLKMYILVNEDIEISAGKLAGQVGHAVDVWFWTRGQKEPLKPIIEEYHQGEIKKIILGASFSLLQNLEERGFVAIRDKGYTELKSNTLTCVNLGIYDFNHLPKELAFVKQLKLYK